MLRPNEVTIYFVVEQCPNSGFMSCRSGACVSARTRCIYLRPEAGNWGCQDNTHLLHCGQFIVYICIFLIHHLVVWMSCASILLYTKF